MSIQRIISQEVIISNDLFDVVESTGVDAHGNVWKWLNDHLITGSTTPEYNERLVSVRLELWLKFKGAADGKN